MQIQKKAFLIAGIVVAAIGAVIFVPTSITAKSYIYADADAKGEMTGSSSKPYKKIQDAIDKAAKENKDVMVLKGTYVENITIEEDVDVEGEKREEVIIIAKDRHQPVVKMEDDTTLRKVTVKDGYQGVLVKEKAHAVIDKCSIKGNKKDGVKAEKADTDEKHQLEVMNSRIHDNGLAGIYSRKRKLVIMNNEIFNNDKEGIDLDDGSKAYIADNSIRTNDGVGMKVHVDGSKIWAEDNSFAANGHEGVQIKANGKSGLIGLVDSKFYNNDGFAITRIEVASFSDEDWNKSIVLDNKNEQYGNQDGFVSPVINVK